MENVKTTIMWQSARGSKRRAFWGSVALRKMIATIAMLMMGSG